MTKHSTKKGLKRWRRISGALGLSLAALLHPLECVWALPQEQDITVVSGTLTYEQVDANTVNLLVSDGSILEYSALNIGANETLNFIMPSIDSFSLNRVVGGSDTQVLGHLNANGNLILINPMGIHFGAAAEINVGSLMASTHALSNQNFLAALNQPNPVYQFEGDDNNQNAFIENEGSITARNGGFVVLAADAIKNTGLISAPMGTVSLAGGKFVEVGLFQDGTVSVAVDEATAHTILDGNGNPLSTQIENSGNGELVGARVQMNAQSAMQVFQTSINQDGVVRADQVQVGVDGIVEILASGDIRSAGSVTGDEISVQSATNIKVSGAYHGGNTVFDAANDIEVEAAVVSEGNTEFRAENEIRVNADVTTTSGNLSFKADSDLNGVGAFIQAAGTTLKTLVSGDITIQSSGQSQLADILAAGSLILSKAGANAHYTSVPGSAIVTGQSLTIQQGVEYSAGNAVLSISKDWINLGVFNASASLVDLIGSMEATVYGDNTFHDFRVLEPEKTVNFEADKTQEFTGTLTVKGQNGKLVTLRSTNVSIPWKINLLGDYEIEYAAIQQSSYINIHGPPLSGSHLQNLSGNTGWDFSNGPVFLGVHSSEWSNPLNWDGGFLPSAFDQARFNSLSVDAFLNTSTTIGSLLLESDFLGVLTLGADLNVAENFTINGGSVAAGSQTLTVGGDWSVNGGNFQAQNSTVVFNDSSKISKILGNNTFNNLIINTPAKVLEFEAGKTQTILGLWQANGAYAQHVRMLSTNPGVQWLVDPKGIVDLTGVWVEDSTNVGEQEIVAHFSTVQNSFAWDPYAIWIGSAGGLWSNAANWDDGFGGHAVPDGSIDVLFGGTLGGVTGTDTNAVIDAGFAGTILSLSLRAGYTQTVSLQTNLTITNGLTVQSGTLDLGGNNISASTLALNGGTISGSTGIATIATSMTVQSGSISAILAGAATLTKSTWQTVTLSGANTYTGITYVNEGVLKLQSDDALGSSAANTVVAEGAVVEIDGSGLSIDEPFDIKGSGVSNGGAIRNLANSNALNGAILLTANSQINSDAGTLTIATGGISGGNFDLTMGGSGDITVSAAISGSLNFTKNGTGRVRFSGTNTYTGATVVNQGALRLMSSNALNGTSGVTVNNGNVSGGSVLEMEGGITINKPLTLYSDGGPVHSPVSLLNVSGTNTWQGTITISYNNTGIGSDAGTLVLSADLNLTPVASTAYGLYLYGAGNYTISGAVSGTHGVLVKEGTGVLTMTANNTYGASGGTIIYQGDVVLSGASGALSTVQTIRLYGGRLILDNTSNNNNSRLADTQSLDMRGGEFKLIGNASTATSETVGVLTIQTGNLYLNTVFITVDPNGNNTGVTTLLFSSLSMGAAVTETVIFRGPNLGGSANGDARIRFTAVPTLTGGGGGAGSTTISIIRGAWGDNSVTGTGTGVLTHDNPSTLGLRLLNTSTEYATTIGVTANANVRLTSGAYVTGGTNVTNSLIMTGNASLSGASALTMTSGASQILADSSYTGSGISAAVSFGAQKAAIHSSANLDISGAVTNSVAASGDALVKSGSATLTFSSASNSFNGIMHITEGTFAVGNSTSVFASTARINVNAGATLSLGAFNLTVADVYLTSNSGVAGSITGSGTLTVTNTITAYMGTISANLAGAATLTVNSNTLDAYVILSGNNTYTGLTYLVGGILEIQSSTALGASSAGTIQSEWSELWINGDGLVINEPITINGQGYTDTQVFVDSNRGALRNLSGNNSWAGLITLGGDARIHSDGGFLSISNVGTITGSTFTLTLGGAANGVVSSIIGTGTGGLTKEGAGTWTINGANTYTGATTVSYGTLTYGASGSLAATALTVNGGTLDINSVSDTIGAVVMTSGSITGTTGVLTGTSYVFESGSVSAILGGAVTLTKNSNGVVILSGANTYTGATTVNAGTLVLSNSSALGTSSGVTMNAGSSIQLQNSITINRPLTINGSAILRSLSGNNTWSATITTGGVQFTSDAGGLLTLPGGVWQTSVVFTGDGDFKVTGGVSVELNSVLAKYGNGTLEWVSTLEGDTSSQVRIFAGRFVFSGSGGGIIELTLSGAFLPVYVYGGELVLDSRGSGNNRNDRLGGATGSIINIEGGHLTLYGSDQSGVNVSESTNDIYINGVGTDEAASNVYVTIFPNTHVSGGSTTLTILNYRYAVGSTVVFRGIADSYLTPGAGVSTLKFGSNVHNYGGGGAEGTKTMSIVWGAFGDASTSGTGTDVIYWNSVTDEVRRLAAAEYETNPANLGVSANFTNFKLTSSGAPGGTNFVNSIIFGAGGGITNGSSNLTMTSTSGAYNILVLSGVSATIAEQIDFSTNDPIIRAVGDLTLSGILTGTGHMTKTGAGVLTVSNTGNTLVTNWAISEGTLRLGASNVLPNTAVIMLSTGATFDLNGFSDTVAQVVLSGYGSGSSISGSGTLTTTGAPGFSFVNGTIGSSVVLAGTTSLTVNTTASNAFSGVVTILSTANTFTGAVTITNGTLVVSQLANSSSNSSIGTGAGTPAITLGASGVLKYTGTGHSTNRAITMAATGGTLDASGTGAVTFSGNVGGNTFGLVLTGTGSGVMSGVIGTTTGTVTKNGTGTWTFSGAGANTYTGATTVNAGQLELSKTAATNAIAGALTIGDRSGVDIVKLINANQIAAVAVTVNSSGVLNLNNQAETIAALNVESGSTTGALVNSGSAVFTLGGNVTHTVGTNTTGAAGALISGNLALGATRTFNIADGAAFDDLNITALVSGATFGVTKSTGTGQMALSNLFNSYTGATTVNAGTLRVSNLANGGVVSSIGASSTTAANLTLGGGTLLYSGWSVSTNHGYVLTAGTTSGINVMKSGTTLTLAGASTNTTGAMTKSGAGILILGAANLYTGLTTINQGTLRYGIANSLSSGAVTVNSGGIFDWNSFADTIGALTVNDGGSVICTGAGATLTITTLSINSGTTGGSIATGSGTLALGGNVTSTGGATNATISGLVSLGATRTFTLTNAADGLTISAVISGNTFGVTKAGSGTLTLTGLNTYTGAVTISAGVLEVNTVANQNSSSSLGTGGGTPAIAMSSSTTFRYIGSGNLSTNRSITLPATAAIIDASGSGSITFTAAFTGTNRPVILTGTGTGIASAVVATGSGSLTKNGTGTWTINASQSYTGATTVNAGTLKYGASGLLAVTALNVNGGTFDINNITDTIGAVTLTSGSIIDSGGSTAILTGASYGVQSGTISARLGGAVGLTKTTAGTVVLSGSNTYTGATTINAGVLSVSVLANGGSNSNIGASTTTAANLTLGGGTLEYTGGSVTINRNFVLTAGTTSTISVTSGAATLTISGANTGTTGALTKGGDGGLTLTGANLATGATVINAGTLTFSGAGTTASTAFTINTGGTMTIDNSGTSNAGRISNTATITMNDGNLNYIGHASTSTNETVGVLTVGSGLSTITVTPGASSITTLTFASMTGNAVGAGGVLLFRGTNLGVSANGNSLIVFTTPPTLTGGGGARGAGNDNVSIIKGAFGDNSLTGTGTDMVSYGGTGFTGVNLLAANEYSATLTAGNNVKLTGSVAATTVSINSLIVGGGFGITGASGTVTVTTGNILSTSGTNSIATNGSTVLALSTTEGKVLVAAGTLTIDAQVTGSAGLTKVGAGTLSLTNSGNTFTGTSIIDGLVVSSSDGSFGNNSNGITFLAGGTLQTTATFTLHANRTITLNGNSIFLVDPSTTLTVDSQLVGTGNLIKNGTGTMTLTNSTNSYSGVTTVNAGTLSVSADGQLGAVPGSATAGEIVLNGGTFQSTADFTLNANRGIALTSGSTIDVASGTLTYNGIIAGASNLTKSGSGSLVLGGVNTYSGTTTISGGTLSIAADSALGAAPGSATPGSLVFNGGTLLTTASFTLSANRGIALTGSSIFDVSTSTTLTYNGIIAGASTLTKNGNGTLVLGGVNTYNGSTTINAGAVSISADSGLGTAPGSPTAGHITFNGGTLMATSTFTLNANRGIALTGNGTIFVSSSEILTYNGILTGAGTLTKTGAGDLNLGGSVSAGGLTVSAGGFNASGVSQLDINGNVLLAGGVFTSPEINFTLSGNWTVTEGQFVSGTGRVNFDGASTQFIDSNDQAFYEFFHNGAGDIQLTSAFTTNAFTNSTGTFDLNGQSFTVLGAAFENQGNIQLRGNETVSIPVPDINSGTWTYDSQSSVNIKDFGATDYYNLVISGSGVFHITSGIVVEGTLTLSQGTLTQDNGAGSTLTTGTFTMSGGSTFNGGNANIMVNGDLNLSGSGTLFRTPSSATLQVITLTVNASGSGKLVMGTSGTLRVTGSGTPVTGTGTIDTTTNTPNTIEFTGVADISTASPFYNLSLVPVSFSLNGTEVLNTDENALTAAVIDVANGFAYFGTATNPGIIIKVRLTDNSRVGALTLGAGESNLTSAVLDGDYAYFATYTSPTKIVKIDLTTFTRHSAITLNSGENQVYSAVVDTTNHYAYFGTYTAPGIIVKVSTNPDNFSRIGAITLNSGENYLYNNAAVIDTTNNFAYFGTYTQPGIVVKINTNPSSFARVGAVSLESGEDYLTSAVIDTTNNFAYFGTYIDGGASGAKIVKVNTSTGTFARVGALTLNNGEDFLTSAVIDTANSLAYFGTDTAPGIVVKVNLSNFTRTSAVTLNAGEDYLYSAVIDNVNHYAYFGNANNPGYIIKMNVATGTFARVGALQTAVAENWITSSVIDTVNGYAYFGTFNSPGIIIKVRLFDNARVAALTLNTGENNLSSAVIDTENNFAYFGTDTAPGIIVKINTNPASFSRVSALTLEAGENYLRTAAVDLSGATNYAYFGTYTTAGKIIKINLTNFTQSGSTLTLNGGENLLVSSAIDTVGQLLYVGTNTNPGIVVKVNIAGASPARVSALTLDAGEVGAVSAAIDVAGGYLYVGTDNSPAKVVKIALSDFTRDSAITLNPGEDFARVALIDAANGYLYIGTYSAPGHVIRIALASFTRDTVIDLSAGQGQSHLTAGVIDLNNGLMYFGTDTIPARIIKINLGGRIRFVGALTVNNNLVIGNGTTALVASALNTVTVKNFSINSLATFTAAGSGFAFNVSGDWTNSGTYNANGGTVTLNGGDQALHGSTTFFSLVKNVTSGNYTLTFDAGESNQTNITGTLTLAGNATNDLRLRSSSAAQFYINPTNTATLSDLDIQYSNNIGAALTANSSVNNGNNAGWTINP